MAILCFLLEVPKHPGKKWQPALYSRIIRRHYSMARFVVPTIYNFTNTWASGTNCSETLYTLHILKLLPSTSYAKYEMSFMFCASYSCDYITQISIESLPRSRIPFVYEFHCFNKLNVVLLIRNWLKGLLSAGQNVWTNNKVTECIDGRETVRNLINSNLFI